MPRYTLIPITKSVLFDGSADWITMGNTFNKERTDSFSISVDVLYTGKINGQLIMSKTNSSGNGGYFLSVVNATSGIVRLAVSNTFGTNNVDRKTNIGLPINTWVKIVATYDGSSTAAGIKIYFDGVEQAMTTVSDNLSSSISNTFNTTIGALNASNYSCWNGKITNVILHNAALTQQEIIDLTFKNIATHVQAQWDWSNIVGSNLPALVGGVAGTLSGAVASSLVPPYFGTRSVAGARSTAGAHSVAPTQQNFFKRSTNLADASYWNQIVALTVTANQGTAPDGTFTATLADDGVATSQHLVNTTTSFAVKAGETWTSSISAKGLVGRYLKIIQSGATVRAIFDLVAGTVTAVTAGATANIELDGQGYYICSLTTTFTADAVANVTYFMSAATATDAYAASFAGANRTYLLTDMQYVKANWRGFRTPTTSAVVNTGKPRNKII